MNSNDFKRIEKSFSKSIKDYETQYKSKHWFYYNDLKNGLFNIKDIQEFRNNDLSLNLDDKPKNPDHLMMLFKKIIEKFGEDFVLKNLDSNNIGNNKKFIKYKNHFVDYNLIHQINIFHEIINIIKFQKNFIICEIGGGYGHLSKLILNNFKSKIILIDLPEANFLSSYYLMENFNNLKFLLYEDIKSDYINQDSVDKYDVIIIPPWIKIKEIKINIFINIRSMMEMTKDIIKTYFDTIQKNIVTGGYFVNINRYLKNSVGSNIMLSEYPYDSHWSLISSKQNDLQPHVHQLITKRISESNFVLDKELKSIKKFTKENLQFVLHGKKNLYGVDEI